MSILVLIRHGQSVWNAENRFTGWTDVELSERGVIEAETAGDELSDIQFDVVHTSGLKRAQRTAEIIMSRSSHSSDVPVFRDERLNERHYGDLQGLNKAETAEIHGAEQVHIWRRSFDVPPPGGESLKMNAERTIPYFEEEILPDLKEGKNVLVSAHGNSLRSIVMHIESISPQDIVSVEIATGTPRFYDFDQDSNNLVIRESVPLWRPRKMRIVESDGPCPTGFRSVKVAGIGMSASMLEPEEINGPADWEKVISDLESWGEVPTVNIASLTYEESPRGPIVRLSGDEEWVAEFLPWGSDGQIRARSRRAPEMCDSPCGGFYWNGRDIAIVRKSENQFIGSEDSLTDALRDNDMESSTNILRSSGAILGEYHTAMEKARSTPPDQKRWNTRNESIERVLRAQFIWRAPFTKEQPGTLSLLDVRFSDVSDGGIRIGPPRLSDALHPHDSDKPAMRDLASLMHDLSRIYYESGSALGIVELRSSLIDGWRSTAPEEWCSDAAFYSHKGGVAIWEYEQCLLDVMEATSHQSGAPEPAITMLAYVRPYQKAMFNNRTFAALSLMSFFFATTTLLNSIPPSLADLPIPLFFMGLGVVCLRTYWGKSPPPEKPFNIP